ncbi:helix-turn-helix domain-containing protein [Nitratifractor sp.]
MFEELENTLKNILQEMRDQKELLRIVLSSLTGSKQVATFLGVSPRTIEGWVRKGIFVEGEHYYRQGKRLVFIPDAIIEFKRHPERRRPKQQPKPPAPKTEAINPTAKRIVAGIKKANNG